MLSIIKSMALLGLNGYLVDIQIDVSQGLPYFGIVGLPDTSVKEAKERVKAAIKNSGYEILNRKIIVNLAPADRKKEGSLFDLPIAVGILACNKIVEYRMLKRYNYYRRTFFRWKNKQNKWSIANMYRG